MTTLTAESLADPKAYGSHFEGMYGMMEDLRANKPVCYVQPEGYRPFWAVSRYDDIKHVETNPEIFLAAPRALCWPIETEEMNVEAMGDVNGTKMLVHMDGDEHRKHRMVAQPWFMPRHLKELRNRVEDAARLFVDEMEQHNGECDFVSDIALWYPLRLAMSMLGVPQEDEKEIYKKALRVLAPNDPDNMMEGLRPEEQLTQTMAEFGEYFGRMTEDRRKCPKDDIASIISNAAIDGEPLGLLELISYYVIVATAGHDTTSYAIAGGMKLFIENPEQLEKLRNNPDLMMNAVDEILRIVTPTKHFMRTAAQDTVVAGQEIKKGENLMLLWASANRDDTVFEAPNTFDIERKNAGANLTFGLGPHHCIGKQLARMEVQCFFEELLARFDNFEIVEEPEYVDAIIVVGLKRLKVKFKNRKNAA
jgi:cytochrome P450